MTERVRSDGYYRWFPGDYMRDTADLSMVEDGAYRRLLDHYYSEDNLSSEPQRLYRICRAFTPEERAAVDFVVGRFFRKENGRLFNNRAERELVARRAFVEEQSRKGKLSGQARRKVKEGAEKEPGLSPGLTPVEPEGQPKPNQVSASASVSGSTSGSGSKVKVKSVVPSGEKPPSVTSLMKHFVKPTLEQVTAYCAERKNRIDPQLFIDSNDAKGWVVGTTKTPMKDWRATIRTWEKRNGSGTEGLHGKSIGNGPKAAPGKYAGIGTVVHTDPGGTGEDGPIQATAEGGIGRSAGAIS